MIEALLALLAIGGLTTLVDNVDLPFGLGDRSDDDAPDDDTDDDQSREALQDVHAAEPAPVLPGAGADSLIGTDGADGIDALAGHDFVNGKDGDDTLSGGEGHDTLKGDDGDDLLDGGAGADLLQGHDGDDSLSGGQGDDSLEGGTGQDVLMGGSGDDLMEGGMWHDLLDGEGGDDSLTGGSGADTLLGGGGADLLSGQDGADVLRGGVDDDLLIGGQGHDNLHGQAGDDTLVGLVGSGWPDGTGAYAPSSDDLDVADTLRGGEGDDRMLMGQGDLGIGGDGQDLFTLGPWIEDEAAVIEDWIPDEDGIEVIYDPSGPLPLIEVRDLGAGDAGLFADAVLISVVSGAADILDASDIALVPASLA